MNKNIAVAGTGYVGLSIATLLAQHNHVTAVDIVPEKVELINNRIILEAKRLLRYSILSVKEIAFRLGFDDPSYFGKFFKRIVKQSPADYRESL